MCQCLWVCIEIVYQWVCVREREGESEGGKERKSRQMRLCLGEKNRGGCFCVFVFYVCVRPCNWEMLFGRVSILTPVKWYETACHLKTCCNRKIMRPSSLSAECFSTQFLFIFTLQIKAHYLAPHTVFWELFPSHYGGTILTFWPYIGILSTTSTINPSNKIVTCWNQAVSSCCYLLVSNHQVMCHKWW